METIHNAIMWLRHLAIHAVIALYVHIYTPLKAWQIRRKKRINVIFVVVELGMWKTEELYLLMLSHPRFNPVIRILPSYNPGIVESSRKQVISYLERKGYPYEFMDNSVSLQKGFRADIIFYYQPYHICYQKSHHPWRNLNALFCYNVYGLHNVLTDFICNQPMHNYAWQNYFENQSCADEAARIMDNHGRNIKVTGLPQMDILLRKRSGYKEVWKPQDVSKKRIIWAPHFSFKADSVLKYSTFLVYCNFMLELADKYKSHVQFAFKPHPLLRSRLYDHWGKERTDAYYKEWLSRENTQLEQGQYIDLFMSSDAMIHDCSAFTQEYLYTLNPVMYLIKDGANDTHDANLNTFGKKAYQLHYKGADKQQIEDFVISIINGKDGLRKEREAFFHEWLTLPYGTSACQNIIGAILGER